MAINLLIISSVLSALTALSWSVQVNGFVFGSNRKSVFRRVRRNLYKSIHDYIDHSVDPCVDFYQHACGNWEKINPIPDDVVDYKPIKALSYHTDLVIKDLLTSPIDDPGNHSAEAKAKMFYSSCVNQPKRDAQGVQPMVDFMETLGGWPVLKSNWSAESFDWLETIAMLRQYGDRILIKESVNYNKKNSSSNIIYLDQPSLGLGNRADYLNSNYAYRLGAYRTYILQVLELFGVNSTVASTSADEILNFETELAGILVPAYQRTNISTFATNITIGDLQLYVPGLNWTKYLSAIFERPVPPTQLVVIKEFKFMNDLTELVSKTDLRIVANYIFWRFAQFKVIRLGSQFEEPLQEIIGVLSGRVSNPPAWKMCVSDVSYHMREFIGALFVRTHFEESDREEVVDMVGKVKTAFLETIYNSSWLDGNTMNLIKKKLNHMSYQIGYPDIIKSIEKINELYENVTMSEHQYFDNFLALLRHTARRKHAKAFQTSETEWSTVSPDLTTAYYNPVKNRMTIPAGLLQQPLFDKFYTKSFNYGRMGALIGHEMAHAFDNIGRNYDYNGNIKSWWNQTLVDDFNEKAECISEQYSHYRIPYSTHMVDSQGTLSENIADNAGVAAAYKAYRDFVDEQMYVEANRVEDSDILSDDAVFFYSFAQLWCGYTRPEAVLTQTRRDPHSPGLWRVVGSLSNLEDFGRVFNCTDGSAMNPIKKCRIW